jgi:hypothetical protein
VSIVCLALAAAESALLRTSDDTLAQRFFPPFFPPLLPIFRIRADNSDLLRSGAAASCPVERSIIACAAWFTSRGCLGLRERFCILQSMPRPASFATPSSPRDVWVDPSGLYLYVAHQSASDNLSMFNIVQYRSKYWCA